MYDVANCSSAPTQTLIGHLLHIIKCPALASIRLGGVALVPLHVSIVVY